MMRDLVRQLTLWVIGGAVCVMCLPDTAVGQTMSFSVYHSESLGSGGTIVYATATVSDNSSGCSHGNYSTTIRLYSPSGRSSVSTASGLRVSTSMPVNAEYGTYSISDTVSFQCSCMHYSYVTAGGGGTFQILYKMFTYKFRRIDAGTGWWIYDRCNPGAYCTSTNLKGHFAPHITSPPPLAVAEMGVLIGLFTDLSTAI